MYLENCWKKLHIFGKSSFLNRESSTMIQTSWNFSPLLMLNLELFIHVWLSLEESIGEFSMVYKKRVLWYGLGTIIKISACNHFISTRFAYSIPDTLLFQARLVTWKLGKKWYLMRMCFNWLCPFKPAEDNNTFVNHKWADFLWELRSPYLFIWNNKVS